jgi:hypothetical protein
MPPKTPSGKGFSGQKKLGGEVCSAYKINYINNNHVLIDKGNRFCRTLCIKAWERSEKLPQGSRAAAREGMNDVFDP